MQASRLSQKGSPEEAHPRLPRPWIVVSIPQLKNAWMLCFNLCWLNPLGKQGRLKNHWGFGDLRLHAFNPKHQPLSPPLLPQPVAGKRKPLQSSYGPWGLFLRCTSVGTKNVWTTLGLYEYLSMMLYAFILHIEKQRHTKESCHPTSFLLPGLLTCRPLCI